MKKTWKVLTFSMLVICLIVGCSGIFAVNLPTDPGYNPNNVTSDDIKTKATSFMGTFVFLVQIACVVTMVIMGLRYMLTSAEGKADVKKGITVWCIGAVLVFGATTIIGLVLNVVVGDKQYVEITPVEGTVSEEEKVVSEWATEYWEKAQSAGLLPNSIKNKPKANISRGEFVESIYLLADKYTNISLDMPEEEIRVAEALSDIKEEKISKTLEKKILKLKNAGIIQGTGSDIDGNVVFSPHNDITRQDVATILYRLLNKAGKTNGGNVTPNQNVDYSSVNDWAKEAMIFMNNKGIIQGVGNGNLDPLGNTTCEQAMTIIYRIYDMYFEKE